VKVDMEMEVDIPNDNLVQEVAEVRPYSVVLDKDNNLGELMIMALG